MGFPETIFGKCPICGGSAADDADASGADQSARDTDGDGVILVTYNGQLMCEVCKNKKIADEQSRISAQKHANEERFRQAAGFRKTID